ncbi:DUF3810 domain-containing protein [Lutispora thermophila]|uniref:DUF3810 domain-containing protein n=1 Tax=Lutispora thermophila DSM 19022 TaxID=1122184 RepID=A0A1M6CCV5_9FIRM|nr:DUF3810 domain-containing protein [Lutispora thermophila]SHI58849.1 Protein of unknown function [Lutispora thermophila DSM 19022]
MLWTAVLIPISLALIYAAKFYPNIIENIYSRRIYKFISQPLSKITGIFPFSLAELVFYIFFLWCIITLIKLLLSIIAVNKPMIFKLIKEIVAVLSILFFMFVSLWGLNYYRLPLSQSLNLTNGEYTKEDLKELCIYLIDKANTYRDDVKENSRGVMELSQGKRYAVSNAYKIYDNIAKKYPVFKGNYGKPKIVMASKLMSYAGIAGIFIPFTIEANVNGDMPDAVFPSSMIHEMAHQRGFAREDEANFIAFLTCIYSDDVDFKYSGTLLALIHSINTLYKVDKDAAVELTSQYGPGLKKDLANINAYWDKFEGPVERASTKLNNTYLKANNQKDGVQSYGRMVDLLLSYYESEILH